MIVCETEFILPDPKNPEIAMTEIDFYESIPANVSVHPSENHALRLRKNLKAGKFEVYRYFFTRKHFNLKTEAPLVKVVFADKDLAKAVKFADGECQKYARATDIPTQVCEHKPPVVRDDCKIWKNREKINELRDFLVRDFAMIKYHLSVKELLELLGYVTWLLKEGKRRVEE